MREHVPETTETTEEPAAAAGALQGPVVERMLALQRSAGNQAVTRLLQRQPASTPAFTPSRFVFILGPEGDEALKSAEAHYTSTLMSNPFRKVLTRKDMSDPTLAGIFSYLSQIKEPIAEITLVTHSNPEGQLSFPLNSADTDESVTADELSQALHDGVLTPLTDGQITPTTRIRLQACFSGHGARMVNLLDRAFAEGEGTVIAPTVEVAYANDMWHSEGLSGWWVTSPEGLTTAQIAAGLKAKYGKSLKLDLTSYQEDVVDENGVVKHRKGEYMKDDDEMWTEIARNALEDQTAGPDGKMQFIYLANPFVQTARLEYEDDPVLYTKSVYYSPKEI
jgi:hypothetical protein